MINKDRRFYIVTGKGGVGKSALSMAVTKSLINKGLNAKYLLFSSTGLSNGHKDLEHKEQDINGIPKLELSLNACAVEYVARKLKSETIAKWVVKTPFFKALLNMMPGFSYLIYLGKSVDLLQKDPNLVFVLDSPSSGHALTMIQSLRNYQEIFQSGLLFEDTQKTITKLFSKSFAKLFIVTLPTKLALNEGLELREDIHKLQEIETSIICNQSLVKVAQLKEENLPKGLKSKYLNEQELLNDYLPKIDLTLPYIIAKDREDMVHKLSEEIEKK